MTKLTNLRTEQNAARRTRGFTWELLYLIAAATIFNAVALAAVAVASGLAAPVQVLIGVSVLALLTAAFSAMVKGLRFFGQPNGSTSRPNRGRPAQVVEREATLLGMRPRARHDPRGGGANQEHSHIWPAGAAPAGRGSDHAAVPGGRATTRAMTVSEHEAAGHVIMLLGRWIEMRALGQARGRVVRTAELLRS